MTGSPWIVGTRHDDKASRLGGSKPATSEIIGGVIRSGGIEAKGMPVLWREPHTALPDPIRILYHARDDGLLSKRCSVLPPSKTTQLALGYGDNEREVRLSSKSSADKPAPLAIIGVVDGNVRISRQRGVIGVKTFNIVCAAEFRVAYIFDIN